MLASLPIGRPSQAVIAPDGVLQQLARERAIDMFVMGAYGHSRLAEFIFGGATRFVLNRLVCPVLMSH